MIPTEDVSRAAARKAEALAAEQGWDAPPRLIALRGIRMLGGTAVAAMELPFADVIPDGNPAVALRFLADHMGEGHLMAELAESLAHEYFCGFAFVVEAWLRTAKTKEELSSDRRRNADIPGSEEIRTATVVDTAGRLTYCHRVRGKEPEVWSSTAAERFVPGGRVPGALRDMVLAVALKMPFGSADIDAIKSAQVEVPRG